ncbi:MAG: class I SAM-dependent methyltransferase [Ignavibacteriales bacterium]|nr:class I SAM-dependent methyltransferase [Ignavibacteriales bacterium]
MNFLTQILSVPVNLFKSQYYWLKADRQNLPGLDFFRFGRIIAFRLLIKGYPSPKLFLNPVSIVRFFEFDFALKNLIKHSTDEKNILDISSPYLFGFYSAEHFSGNYTYLNPDKKDLSLVKKYSSKLTFNMNYKTDEADATKLSYENNSFTSIISISVIEHINNNGDLEAIKELWRVLKPDGILILTFPAGKIFSEQFRDDDVYGLNNSQRNNKYFFQRIYDDETLKSRLLNQIDNFTILDKEIFGETISTFYSEYEKRWKQNRFSESVKDPFYISKYFKRFNSTDKLPGMGVIGIAIRKIK